MRECDSVALMRGLVVVDTYAGARGEAGDLLQAIDDSEFSFDDVHAELAEVLRGDKAGRRHDDDITVFKSVGASLEDLAAAIEVWQQYAGA